MKTQSASIDEGPLVSSGPTRDADDSPVDAMKAGALDAQAAVANIGPSLSRGVYRLAYSVSYGVVYSALVLRRWIPAHSAVAEGVRDGASAAEHDFNTEKKAAAVSGYPDAGLATA